MRRLALLIPLAALAACSPAAEPGRSRPERLIVSAAASLTPVLGPVAAAYTERGGPVVELNLAASSTLAAQIISGAPVDLFISADVLQMDRVAARGRIEPDTRVDLLSNQLVVVAPPGGLGPLSSPADLAGPGVRRVAIGDPAGVPVGVYAKAYLESHALWERLGDRVLPMVDVRAALATVAAGDADAGIVYRTDALSSPGVATIYEIPVDEGPRITYPAAVVAGTAAPEAARRLLAYLGGAEASAMFEAAGFILPRTASPAP